MRKLLLLSLLALGYQSALAQLVTESFGTGANAFTMDFVTIGNPNNTADTTGFPNPAGSVSYIYRIGKYEVSREMIEKANIAGGLNIQMRVFTDPDRNANKKPASEINWDEGAKFVNWLNTSTGNTVAYKFDQNGNFQIWSVSDSGYDANNLFRNSLARYYLPNDNEWYKAAYGSPDGAWFNYPTGSNTAPEAVSGGTNANTAVYGQSIIADVDNAGGLSAYETMAQGGNLREWIETAFDKINDTANENRVIRGGPWYGDVNNLDSSNRFGAPPALEEERNGFRVAMVPKKYSLQVNYDSAKGEVIINPLMIQFIEGATVTVSASASPGYLFSNWSGDISGTTSSVTLTMNANKSITGNFGQDTRDSDGDGLSNYLEIITHGTNPDQKDTNSDGVEDGVAVSLGYSPTFNFSALTMYWQVTPPTGLYTASQMQAMAIGDLVLTKNANGSFTLNYDIEQSADLQTWTTYAPLSLPLTGLPTDKAFVRIKAKQ